MSAHALIQGDVRAVLEGYRDNVFDALFCDPPYGLSFMGKRWDYDVPDVATWRECLRVLKPGAPLLAFGGSRTYHRLACGIEDAGFELFDSLAWIYARGMPKPATTSDKYIDAALKVERPMIGTRKLKGTARIKGGGGYTVEATEGNYATNEVRDTIAVTAPGCAQSKLWEGYGHALRPSFEPIAFACKPFDGTIANNLLEHEVGGLNIAGCQLSRKTHENPRRINEGCWPANVVFGHTEDCEQVGSKDVRAAVAVKRNGVRNQGALEGMHGLGTCPEGTPDKSAGVNGIETVPVWSCPPHCPVRQLDELSGERPSNPFPANVAEGNVLPFTARSGGGLKDTGGASRFFYCPKVSRGEREAGCEYLPLRTAAEATGRREGTVGANRPQAGAGRGSGYRNIHPTLKPLALTTWLARLILPPTTSPVLLVPFAGAGSEMIGALIAGWGFVVGIEREGEYLEIARARLAHWAPESEAA